MTLPEPIEILFDDADLLAVNKPAGLLVHRCKIRERMPEWAAAAPEMPQLVHAFLKKAAAGDFDATRSARIEQREGLARAQRRQLAVLPLAAASLLSAALLYAFDSHGAQWLHVPLSAWIALAVSAAAFVVVWRHR